MTPSDWLLIGNGKAVPSRDCPIVPLERFRRAVIDAVAGGARLSAMPAWPNGQSDSLNLMAVVSFPAVGKLGLLACDLPRSYPAITPDCPAAHWFERELAETWQVRPQGHPWLKPIRFGPPLRMLANGGSPAVGPVGFADFFCMSGDEVHEVAVGPVHAGVIEPGHFRFQCHGETVYHLEISLGYQHRGIERAMLGGPTPRSIHYMETLAGDTTIGHATAYASVIEALSGVSAPPRAEAIRAIAAELERIANHTGDLGAMAGDVGFLPTMSYCGRIRGDVLNLTALLCGNRFGRGLIRPGGAVHDFDAPLAEALAGRLESVSRDITSSVELLFATPSVLSRFEETGSVAFATGRQIGLVGVPARASNIACDIRNEFAYGLYRFAQIPVCTWHTGDCFARAYVRWLEIKQSLGFLLHRLGEMPAGETLREPAPLRPDMMAVGLVEGWRGEICHVAVTGGDRRFRCYKVVDPSFHNWFGLACALRDQQISDFPLCNKSFNLSYCGHDL